MISDTFLNILANNFLRYKPNTEEGIKSVIFQSLDQFRELPSISEISGSSLWGTLHWIARAVDLGEANRDDYNQFLLLLCRSHPCEKCRKHLTQNLSRINPDHFSSCFEHAFTLHNYVNKILDKPIYDYENVRDLYKFNPINCNSCVL